MKRTIGLVIALFIGSSAHAAPVPFNSVTILADAFTGFGLANAIDSNGIEIPPGKTGTSLPLSASASSSGASFADVSVDFDSDTIFLTGTTEASSQDGSLSDASASAELVGSFSGAGNYRLSVVFDSINELFNAGLDDFSEGSVTASLVTDSTQIFSESLFAPGELSFDFSLDDRATGLLSVFVVSGSSTFSEDSIAFNLSDTAVDFSVQPVPLPGALFFLVSAIISSSLFGRLTSTKNIIP